MPVGYTSRPALLSLFSLRRTEQDPFLTELGSQGTQGRRRITMVAVYQRGRTPSLEP